MIGCLICIKFFRCRSYTHALLPRYTSTTDLIKNKHESGRRSSDELSFKDIPHSASEAMETSKKTHKFTEFPPGQGDSDPEDDEADDRAELLEESDQEKKSVSNSFWTFEYYQQFFDVDSVQVGKRILWSMIPHPKTNFLQSQVRPNPDLYGPFWICTTLVFCMAIAGNIASYIQQTGQDFKWSYDFHKVTFSATAIYSYWWLLPAIIWGVLYWRGNKAGITFLEILCIYGYSLSIFIPISILWVIQINWLQWLLVMLGMAMSGTVLLLTFWPVVRNDNKKVAVAAMVLIVLFHGLLAVSFMLYFFHVPDSDLDTSQSNKIIANKTDSISPATDLNETGA